MAIAGRQGRSRMSDLMRGIVETSGPDSCKPKHHWAFDIFDQLETDDQVVDSLTLERLHLRIRSVADACATLRDFERDALAGVINNHAQKCNTCVGLTAAAGRFADFPGVAGAQITDWVDVAGARFHVGDVVLFGSELVGFVVACAFQEDKLYLAVDELRKDERSSPEACICAPAGRRSIWEAHGPIVATAWIREPDGRFLVVER